MYTTTVTITRGQTRISATIEFDLDGAWERETADSPGSEPMVIIESVTLAGDAFFALLSKSEEYTVEGACLTAGRDADADSWLDAA